MGLDDKLMEGLSFKSMKKHYSLIPLFGMMAVAVTGCAWYCFRLASKNPDVSWNRSKNPNPNEEYRNKQYKFYSPNLDYSKLEDKAPKF